MNGIDVAPILQYATLFSLLIGGLGLAIATFHHREQMKTQIFLALSARYDELLHSSSADVWLSIPCDDTLPERTQNVTISALRFCTLVSLTYFLFRERHIPKRMWKLMLQSAERRLQSPLFAREWGILRSEFESFPEFVALVGSVQQRRQNEGSLVAGRAWWERFDGLSMTYTSRPLNWTANNKRHEE